MFGIKEKILAAKRANIKDIILCKSNEKDILEIKNLAQNNIIITTEKDYVRLKGRLPSEQLFYLPIQISFLSGSDDFDKNILNYVGTSTRNR